MEKFTAETFFENRIRLHQPRTGYRHSLDPILLCAEVPLLPRPKILDIGCGCGIIPLILGYRNAEAHIIGVEVQAELAELAKLNITSNQMTDQILIFNKNIKDISLSHTQGRVDLIISNPPYKKKDTGRLNLDPQKAIARHELMLTIEQVFANADMLLKPKGRIMVIFPADRIQDLLHAMTGTRIHLDWLKFIHTQPGKNAKRVILSGVKNIQGSSRVLSPFCLYDEKNNPTKAYTDLFNP